jgi:hypothetical protein
MAWNYMNLGKFRDITWNMPDDSVMYIANPLNNSYVSVMVYEPSHNNLGVPFYVLDAEYTGNIGGFPAWVSNRVDNKERLLIEQKLRNKLIAKFTTIEEMADDLTTGNVTHKKTAIKGVALRAKDYLIKHT